MTLTGCVYMCVALRKESVDRNLHAVQIVIIVMQSLSARRAWIEIRAQTHKVGDVLSLSARRAWIEIEFVSAFADHDIWSLSARRAWIEIMDSASHRPSTSVALRKESVDRNCAARILKTNPGCRSPQGERG